MPFTLIRGEVDFLTVAAGPAVKGVGGEVAADFSRVAGGAGGFELCITYVASDGTVCW